MTALEEFISYLRHGAPEGTLAKGAVELYQKAGFEFYTTDLKKFYLDPNLKIPRRLLFNKERYLSFIRPHDIWKLVQEGILDVAICPFDYTVENAKIPLEDIIDDLSNPDKSLDAMVKGFKRAGIIPLAVLLYNIVGLHFIVKNESDIQDILEKPPITIATEFPHIIKEFFKSKNINDVKILKTHGCTEAFVIIEAVPAIADIIATGSTLEKYNLRDKGMISVSVPFLVSNPNAYKMKKELINRFARLIKDADGKKIEPKTIITPQSSKFLYLPSITILKRTGNLIANEYKKDDIDKYTIPQYKKLTGTEKFKERPLIAYMFTENEKKVVPIIHEEDMHILLKMGKIDIGIIGLDHIIENESVELDEGIDELLKDEKREETEKKYILKTDFQPLANTGSDEGLFLIIKSDLPIDSIGDLNKIYKNPKICTRYPHLVSEIMRIKKINGEVIKVQGPISYLVAGGADCAIEKVIAWNNMLQNLKIETSKYGYKVAKPLIIFSPWWLTTKKKYQETPTAFDQYAKAFYDAKKVCMEEYLEIFFKFPKFSQ